MINFFENLPAEVFDAIGVAGFGLYVLNYTLLTVRRLNSECLAYFSINLLAASMVLIGMTTGFNLASMLIQVFWIGISIIAIFLRLRQRTGRQAIEVPTSPNDQVIAA